MTFAFTSEQSPVASTPSVCLSRQLGARLKARRLARNLRQDEVASRAGVSVGTVKNIEARGQASVDTLVRVAAVLGFEDMLSELFSDVAETNRKRARATDAQTAVGPENVPRTVSLEPLVAQHQSELIAAARAVASDGASAARLWWAKKDYSKADAHGFIGHCVNDRLTGHGDAFAVRDAAGTFIGCVSAKNIDRLHGCFQGGYWLVPSARGRGLGQASLRALFDWAVAHGLVRMELLIGSDNAVSLAAASRVGAQFEGKLRGRFLLNDTRIDVNLMALVHTPVAKH